MVIAFLLNFENIIGKWITTSGHEHIKTATSGLSSGSCRMTNLLCLCGVCVVEYKILSSVCVVEYKILPTKLMSRLGKDKYAIKSERSKNSTRGEAPFCLEFLPKTDKAYNSAEGSTHLRNKLLNIKASELTLESYKQ